MRCVRGASVRGLDKQMQIRRRHWGMNGMADTEGGAHAHGYV